MVLVNFAEDFGHCRFVLCFDFKDVGWGCVAVAIVGNTRTGGNNFERRDSSGRRELLDHLMNAIDDNIGRKILRWEANYVGSNVGFVDCFVPGMGLEVDVLVLEELLDVFVALDLSKRGSSDDTVKDLKARGMRLLGSFWIHDVLRLVCHLCSFPSFCFVDNISFSVALVVNDLNIWKLLLQQDQSI